MSSIAVLAIVIIGFAVMVGAIRPGRALRWILLCTLFSCFLPFLWSLLSEVLHILPWWLLMIGGLILLIRMFRFLSALFIGTEPADIMLGDLAAAVLRSIFRLLMWPLRLLFRA
jgi:hypothetical protein